MVWLALTYTIPVKLVLGPRTRPVLGAVNGTWFIWVVGAQSIAVSIAVLHQAGVTHGRLAPLVAVLMWSVGVALYLLVAMLVVTRLLLVDVRPQDLTPPYWVTMGATAITVLAAAQKTWLHACGVLRLDSPRIGAGPVQREPRELLVIIT